MTLEPINSSSEYKEFRTFAKTLYKKHPYHRSTEDSIEKLLLNSISAFHHHAKIYKYLLRDQNTIIARFALINDLYNADYVQVAYFEALENQGDIFNIIKKEARKQFPKAKKVVVGLNGHLNYGAGILLNKFDETPVFGLPYNPHYYQNYFTQLTVRKMFTFRFSMDIYSQWAESYKVYRTKKDLEIRFMDKKNIKAESAIYTNLNNLAFTKHPYWANRETAEDIELFYPFRYLLDDENLIIATINSKPVGFFLWYPDYNQLVSSDRDLNVLDVIKYRVKPKIDTFRFTEIGIIPQFQRSPVALALINKSLPALQAKDYKYCEGGFIFEENKASIAFVKRILKRCYGYEPQPYREYAVFETDL